MRPRKRDRGEVDSLLSAYSGAATPGEPQRGLVTARDCARGHFHVLAQPPYAHAHLSAIAVIAAAASLLRTRAAYASLVRASPILSCSSATAAEGGLWSMSRGTSEREHAPTINHALQSLRAHHPQSPLAD